MRAMAGGRNGVPATVMTIGQAARRSGFTIKALRFYERCGVLPAVERRASGYRLYRERDLDRLDFIRQAKALGLTLGAIRELVHARRPDGDMPHRLLRTLDRRIGETTERIAALTRLRRELQRRRRAVARRRPRAGRGESCTCLKTSARGG